MKLLLFYTLIFYYSDLLLIFGILEPPCSSLKVFYGEILLFLAYYLLRTEVLCRDEVSESSYKFYGNRGNNPSVLFGLISFFLVFLTPEETY
jgi:hypothetical protein